MAVVISKRVIRELTSRNKVIARPLIPKRFMDLDAWVYRSLPKDPPRSHVIGGKALNAFTWWWMLVHSWYQFDHLVGEFEYPDMKAWTNEELGVVENF